jgi:hypothetical protein
VTDDEHTHLQRQIVELRMRMEQQAEAQAALIEHAVSRAVDAKMGGRSLTEAEREWVRSSVEKAGEHKKMRGAIFLHLLQWGIGGSVGFLLWSVWESLKLKLKQ